MTRLGSLFGQRVKIERKKRGISQEALALRAGIDRSHMSRIERGIVGVTLEKVYRIAIAIDCEPADLLPPKNTPLD
ncbi:helix-turn-helix domain-containing protein [Microbulbifer pacificus]|uniref:Helix-turn-helix transcriptional regulator n=1 Tax=Microbulbifer pacificus TaxID=407164 RepID=A0AAU0N4M3_9GAMM|nr:helix-turn-helix transcriptional regulator [Microbulbifer pacificus]WOX06991.1 helix-turn-helix transcriptional regulator [Microbulbifer pacificus]